MNDEICIYNVIRSKLVQPGFLIKLIICIVLLVTTLCDRLDTIPFLYQNIAMENGNILMYLLMVFTDPDIAYYSILLSFAILVSDIVYEEYLTKNIYVMYKSRKNIFLGMLKLTTFFSLLFIVIFFVLAMVIGFCGGLDMSFDFTPDLIEELSKEQDFYLLRTAIYLPKSILNYKSFVVLGMVVFKYYVGLILLSMFGFIFSIKNDSVQNGAVALLIMLLFHIAILNYYGPWRFYSIGISIDLTDIFSYFTLQRFFIYDFAGIKEDVVILFRDTMLTGVIWFMALSAIIYNILKKKDI